MSKLNKYGKLLVVFAACAVSSGTVYARLADSIFGNEDVVQRKSAAIAKMKNPSVSEQARYEFYDGKKIPAVELEPLLAAAERAANAVIEEHNRRIDIMSMQEVYIKNKHSTAVANKAKALLDAADACNGAQISVLFSCSGQEYRPANVSLDGIQSEDKWNDYPTLCSRIWYSGLKPKLIGTYTEKLNDMKFKAGIWWGGAFEPTFEESLFRKKEEDIDKIKSLSPAARKAWKTLVNNDYVKKRAGAKGLVNGLPQSALLFRAPATSEDEWNSAFNPSDSEESARAKIQEYNKQRWLLGFNYLTDIYHNWVYGTPVFDVRTNLWIDQRTRYRLEIVENFMRYHESHYSGTQAKTDRPDMSDEKDWDNLGSTWGGKISAYQGKWASIHNSENRYTCCETCCDESSCRCCPGEYKLIKDVTPPSKDSGERPREVSCPDKVTRGPDLGERIQQPPRPLILNNGRPSIEESVFIDVKNGRYELYTGAVPDVWHVATFNKTEGYIGPKTASPRDFRLEDFTGGEYAKIASSPGNLANNASFPFNQNRISAYLDIYEEYVRAKNNEAKLVGPFGENSRINESLKITLEQLKNRLNAGYYDLYGAKAAEALSNKITTDGNFDNPQKIERLYQESIDRENWFFGQAKALLAKIGSELRKEQNRTTYNYDRALGIALSSENPEDVKDSGTGPKIPSNSDESLFLYRLGRVYQTLAYFGTENIITGQSSVYTPDVSKITAAMSAASYGEGNIGDFETKVERIRFDGRFEPPSQANATKWLSGNAHTSRSIPSGMYKGSKVEKSSSEYIQIGPAAKLSSIVAGKTVSDLEEGRLQDLVKAFDDQRKERFQKADLLISTRKNVAVKQTASLNGVDGGEDYIFSNRNFDTSTCMFKHRDSR